MRLQAIQEHLRARLVAPSPAAGEIEITRIAPIDQARAGEITFVASPDYMKHLTSTSASAVILKEEVPGLAVAQIIHRDPYWAFAKTAQLFHRPRHDFAGVSPEAVVREDVELGEDVTLYPGCYVARGARIGHRVVLYPGVFVGADAVIGEDTVIHANTVVGERCIVGRRVLVHAGSVIGADGFGFAVGEGEIVKIPQVGIVRIEDDVELGGVCTIDRAAMGETVIGRGTKLDSKVHVGHNAIIGQNCLFSALTGIAGSARVGNWVMIGGHGGVSGHLSVGDGAKIGAMSGVVQTVEGGETYMGFPAIPAGEWRRRQVHLKRLADYEKKIRSLEERLQKLEARGDS